MPAETVSCAVIPTAYLCFHGGALRRFNMPLIVTREVHRGTTLEGQFCHPADLSAVIHAPGIFPERRFLSIAQQIRAANVVEVPHFATAQAGEVASPIVVTDVMGATLHSGGTTVFQDHYMRRQLAANEIAA